MLLRCRGATDLLLNLDRWFARSFRAMSTCDVYGCPTLRDLRIGREANRPVRYYDSRGKTDNPLFRCFRHTIQVLPVAREVDALRSAETAFSELLSLNHRVGCLFVGDPDLRGDE